MFRSFREKLESYESDPDAWEVVSIHTDRAARKGARQSGVSTQTMYRDRLSLKVLVRHRVIDDRGRVVDDHFRPQYKPREGDLQ